MSDPINQVRPKPSLLTDMNVRDLLAPALVRICAQHGNDRAALEIGVDEKTVRRARDKETTLKTHSVFNALAIDPSALDLVLAHFGLMTIPMPTEVRDPMVNVADLTARIAQAKSPDSPGGTAIVHGEVRSMAKKIDEVILDLLAIKADLLDATKQREMAA